MISEAEDRGLKPRLASSSFAKILSYSSLPTSVIQNALMQQGADLSMYSPGANLHIDDDMSNSMMDSDYPYPFVSCQTFFPM